MPARFPLLLVACVLGLALSCGAPARPAQAQDTADVTFTPYTSYKNLHAVNDDLRRITAVFGNGGQRPLIDPKGEVSRLSETLYLFRFGDDCAPLGCRTVAISLTAEKAPELGMYLYTPGPFRYNAARAAVFVCTDKGEFVEWAGDGQGAFAPVPHPIDSPRETCQPLMPE